MFGWQFEQGETKGYWMIKNAGISGALMQKENPQQISTIFTEVESIEDYVRKSEQMGAKVVKNKNEIHLEYGRVNSKFIFFKPRANTIIFSFFALLESSTIMFIRNSNHNKTK